MTPAGDRWVWTLGGPVTPEVEDYLRYPAPEEGRRYEANLEALRWVERMGGALREGWMLTIDYGFTQREAARFPGGTLMSTGGTRRGKRCSTIRASRASPRT